MSSEYDPSMSTTSLNLNMPSGRLTTPGASSTLQSTEKPCIPFIEEDSFSDIVLVVEGKRLYTSRTLLSMASPVFARMLTSTESKGKKEIPISGKSYDHVLELLYILHPAYQRRITDQIAFAVLPLAEEYQIWNLKQKCEETLLNNLNIDKNAKEDLLLKCLHVADEYKLFALWTKCLQLCSKSSLQLNILQRNPEYENLSKFLKSMLEAFKGNGEMYKSTSIVNLSDQSSRRDGSSRSKSVSQQTQTKY